MKFISIVVFITTSLFSASAQVFEQTNDNLTQVYSGKIKWADLDNDHDLDLMYSGFTQDATTYFTKVYENSGGALISRTSGLPDIRNGDFALGDFDNDGDLDVLLSGLNGATNISKVYRNNGAFSFSLAYSFPGLINSSVSWADIDNDGDIDFVLGGVDDAGGDPNDPFPKKMYVYENTGGAFSPLSNTNLPPCTQSSMDWADSNGDGYVDLLISGYGAGTAVYLNNGNHTFTKDTKSTLRELSNGDAKWGDFDNDGDVDAMVCGYGTDFPLIHSVVYENNGQFLQERSDIVVEDVGENWFGGTAWMDYDNDGDLDILAAGRGESGIVLSPVFNLYKNDGTGKFALVSPTGLVPRFVNSLDFGDYDNDGDLDLNVLGITMSVGPFTGVYRNRVIQSPVATNAKPLPPQTNTFFESRPFRKGIRLNWGAGSDGITPGNGLSYNFYLRSATGNLTTPAVDFTTGFQRTTNPSNGQGRNGNVNNLPEGQLFWAVQTVDGGKEGSVFSSEKSFFQLHGPESKLAQIVDQGHVKLTWIDNSGIETNYRVDRSLLVNSAFTTRATLAANTETFTDADAFATDTYYYYRLYAFDASHTSPYDSLQLLIPTAPANLQSHSINAATISLAWEDHSGFETGYVVERKESSASLFVEIVTLPASTVAFTEVGLAEGTSYDYRIRAINDYGSSAFSNITSAKTNWRPTGGDFARTLKEDSTLTFFASDFINGFSDADSGDELDAIVLAAFSDKGSLTLNGTLLSAGDAVLKEDLGGLQFVPFSNVNGPASFTFYVSDGTDNSAAANTVTLSIEPVNDPPAFTLSPLADGYEDFVGNYIVNPIVTPVPQDETSQVVHYSIDPVFSEHVNVKIDSLTGVITFSAVANESGEIDLIVSADDGQPEHAVSSVNFKFIIHPVNDLPVLSEIPDLEVEEKETIEDIPFTVEDADDPFESLVLTAHSSNQALLADDGITLQGSGKDRVMKLSVKPRKLGETTITLKASDGKDNTTRLSTLKIFTVTGLDDPAENNAGLFPNPVAGALTISISPALEPPFQICLSDVLGREWGRHVTESRESGMDLQALEAGVYVVRITGSNMVSVQSRLVKK